MRKRSTENIVEKPKYWLFVQDRESGQWLCQENLRSNYSGTGRRRHRFFEPSSYVYPKPEAVNCFVKQHKIIKAKTEAEAWQILNSK